jgi:predicted permease
VIGALLFTRTLRNLGAVDLGFNPEVIDASIDLRRSNVAPGARSQAFGLIRAALQQVPGVQQAGEALIVPLGGADWNGAILRDGVAQKADAHFNQVGGSYFRALDIPLVGGRTFDDRDRIETPKVVVVNQAFARRFFPNTDPIGQTFQMDIPSPQPSYQVVGVVGDTKIRQLRDDRTAAGASFTSADAGTTFLPIAYLPVSQSATPPPDLHIVIRTDLPAASVTRALTTAITDTVPGATVSYETVTTYINGLLVSERLMAWLSGFFGLLALLVAAIGLYGVMSYLVSCRRVEIGVRMALGAQPDAVVRMVLTESATLLAAGVAAGVLLAGAVSRYATTLLFGVSPIDPTSFVLGTAALAVISLLACYVPARRAAQIDPTTALRDA